MGRGQCHGASTFPAGRAEPYAVAFSGRALHEQVVIATRQCGMASESPEFFPKGAAVGQAAPHPHVSLTCRGFTCILQGDTQGVELQDARTVLGKACAQHHIQPIPAFGRQGAQGTSHVVGPMRFRQAVCIRQDQPVKPCIPDARSQRPLFARRCFFVLQHRQSRVLGSLLREPLSGAIAGAVVHNQPFHLPPRWKLLPHPMRPTLLEGSEVIVGAEDKGDGSIGWGRLRVAITGPYSLQCPVPPQVPEDADSRGYCCP